MKSLRSAGQRGGVARGGQMLGAALERRRVGEHRQAGRAAGLVGARQRRRIEIGADQSLRRARLLDLGDQRVVAGRKLALDRGEEAARRRRRLGRRLDRRGRTRALRRRDLLALVGLDLGKDVGHPVSQPFDTCTSRSRRALAAPELIDFAACATPCLRSLARPATTSPAAAFMSATSRNGPLRALEHGDQRLGVVLGVAAAQASPASAGRSRPPRA